MIASFAAIKDQFKKWREQLGKSTSVVSSGEAFNEAGDFVVVTGNGEFNTEKGGSFKGAYTQVSLFDLQRFHSCGRKRAPSTSSSTRPSTPSENFAVSTSLSS